MRLAVIGSRRLYVRDLGPYLPDNVTEIVSGGAKGIDGCAGEYARRNVIPLTEFLPDYRRYGKGAPFKRDLQIIDYADELLAFWDGHSRGTDFVIRQARLKKKKITVIRMDATP